MSEAALEIAMRTLSESRTLDRPLERAVLERTLEHHWRGLYEYAALRVGAERAGELLHQLSDARDSTPSADPASAGGALPALYALVRSTCRALLERARADHDELATRGESFWHASDERQDAALARVRSAIGDPAREAAELCFARGLKPEQVAVVMALPEQKVRELLQQARTAARAIAGGRAAATPHAIEALWRQALSLDPRRVPELPRPAREPVVACGDVVASRYEIEARLGSGAFADVYRARDRDVEGHVVALKISRTASTDELSTRIAMRELRLLASVFHPSVVQLKDHGWHRGHLWFVMPLYRGETLSARLRRGPLSRAEARAVFTPLAEALATMHRAGVLHQDVKPANIFLADIEPTDAAAASAARQPPGRRVLPVLLDLGVAAKDAEAVVAGTPAYLAPEIAARFAGLPDPAPAGPKADVFSLALTLRDALAPADGADPPLTSVDAFVAHRAAHAPRPPSARALRDLAPSFERWLHRSPDARPSAAELGRELGALTAPAERSARRAATLRWLLPTAAALFVVFGAVVHTLSREAALRRLEAANARVVASHAEQLAATMHADLTAERALSHELEQSVQRLEREYLESRLTRDDLAKHLAAAEGELEVARERLARASQRGLVLQAELTRTQLEREEQSTGLRAARQRVRELHRSLQRAREQVSAQRQELAGQSARVAHMERRLASLELALERSRSDLATRRSSARAQESALTQKAR